MPGRLRRSGGEARTPSGGASPRFATRSYLVVPGEEASYYLPLHWSCRGCGPGGVMPYTGVGSRSLLPLRTYT